MDADEEHRVTLMASTDLHGKALPTFDGSTYDPFAKRLLYTAEDGPDGGVWAAALGGYGALYRIHQPSPTPNAGILSMFFRGNPGHTGLDNLAFFGSRRLVAVEDAGDTLHAQRDALDSAYLFDTSSDYSTEQGRCAYSPRAGIRPPRSTRH